MSPAPADLRLSLALVSTAAAPFGHSAGAYLAAQVLADPALAPRVDVRVLRLDSDDPDAAARRLLADAPDVVGLSCYAWSWQPSLAVARRLREARPKLVIVLGGPLFAQLRVRHDWFTAWDAVDAVAIGDGEHTLRQLLADLLAKGRPFRVDRPGPGLALPGTPPRFGPPPQLAGSLDELASPYLLGTATPVDNPHVEVTRGCPFACSFCGCSRTVGPPRLRLPRGDRLAREVAAIAAWERPVDEVNLGASTANLDDATWAALRGAIDQGDPARRHVYSLQIRPELLKPRHVAGWGDARLRFAIGAQSLAPATFAAMGRTTRLDELRRAVDLLRDLGPVGVFLILGLPGETLDSFRAGLDEVAALDVGRVAVSPLYVLPGTPLHTRHEAFGLDFDPLTFRVRATPTMSAADRDVAVAYVRAWDADLRAGSDTGERHVAFDG